MNEADKDLWAKALTTLESCPEELREHFARLILKLAVCYDTSSENRAVILLSTDENLTIFGAGADEEDTAAIINHAALVFLGKDEEGYVN